MPTKLREISGGAANSQFLLFDGTPEALAAHVQALTDAGVDYPIFPVGGPDAPTRARLLAKRALPHLFAHGQWGRIPVVTEHVSL